MAYHHDKSGITDGCHCMRCGKPIKVIGKGCDFPLLTIHGAEQRGFQCIVCGCITCFDCSDNRFRCSCGGNAWIARVYEMDFLQPLIVKRRPGAGAD